MGPGYELWMEHYFTHAGNPRADCIGCFPPEATPLVVFHFPGRPNPFERDGPPAAMFDGPFPPELGERPANPFQRDLSSFGGPEVAPGDRLGFDDSPWNVINRITLKGLDGPDAERELADSAREWLREYAEDPFAESGTRYSGDDMMAAWRAGYDQCADDQDPDPDNDDLE
jgi:hypothetical protein